MLITVHKVYKIIHLIFWTTNFYWQVKQVDIDIVILLCHYQCLKIPFSPSHKQQRHFHCNQEFWLLMKLTFFNNSWIILLSSRGYCLYNKDFWQRPQEGIRIKKKNKQKIHQC